MSVNVYMMSGVLYSACMDGYVLNVYVCTECFSLWVPMYKHFTVVTGRHEFFLFLGQNEGVCVWGFLCYADRPEHTEPHRVSCSLHLWLPSLQLLRHLSEKKKLQNSLKRSQIGHFFPHVPQFKVLDITKAFKIRVQTWIWLLFLLTENSLMWNQSKDPSSGCHLCKDPDTLWYAGLVG